MKYALLIYSSDADWDNLSEDERNAIYGEYAAVSRAPASSAAQQLGPARHRDDRARADGSTLTTDGPFAETKEGLGGFFLLEADNLDDAIAMAARIPAARMGGAVEVRPLVEM